MNPVISHENVKEDWLVTTTNGTYRLSSATQMFHNGYPISDDNRKNFGVIA
jgi:hypothetical protein